MVLQVYILLEFFALALAACPQVPSAGLLPSEAVQDCGTSTADLDLCPFNCTLAWSHAGRLQCQNDTWQADDPNDLPRCIAPCLAETLANGYGERADVLGYLPGFWASPETPPTTTTTGMPCDTVGAQSCLQTVVAITDIQEFCARLPTAVECLKVAGCCQQAQGTIVGSIDSCATSGYTVEDPCTNDMEAQCRVTCAPGLVGAEANNASCTSLKRTPFCMRSQSCCPYWSTLGLDTLASNCTALGYDISDACGASNSFLVANEGAEVRVTCQSPRYANGSSHEDYLCQNSSFELTPPSQSKLQCVDPPCALARNANGTYQCFSDGQLLSLADAAVMQVPFGTSCTLQCSKSFEVPTPPMELHCAYVESDSSDIIYRDPLMVTSTGVPRMVERLADGSLRPAVPQVCEIMTCPLPSVQGLPAVVAGNMPQANASGEILYIECDGLSQFARCSPVCAYGYEVDSLRYLLCDTGTFQGEVRCVKQRCAGSAPWPFGTSGSLSSCTDGLHGQFCEVLCAAGYTRDSNLASYQCEAGQWMVPTTPPCIESSCFAAPVLENAQRLQACANRPAGYECNVTCLSGYQPVGSLRCVQGAYELSGLGCVASAVATRTAQVAAAQVVLVSVSEAEANTTRGRVERSARGLLGLDATVTPAQLATLVAEEVPSISPLDRALALAALQQLSPEAALRAALRTLLTAAIIPEVEAIFPVVEVALTRLDAHGVWANASEVLVQSSPSNLDQWLTATLQRLLGASLSATALQALAQDGSADAVDRTSLELQRVFSASLARSMTTAAALSATALVHYEMGESLPQTEMDALHLALVSRFGQLLESSAGTSVPSEFDAQWAAAIQRFNLQDHASSVAALGALASRVTSLGGSMELVAALAMQGFWQLRTVCADTLLRCQRQEERRWIEAGRASAQLAKWRPGGFLNAAEIAAAVPRVSGGGAYLLAGALSTFGVEEQDLTLLMPGAADARKAFALSQVTSIEALQRLPTYTAVGFNLGVLLGYDLGVMTPLEGELAMEWAGDQVAGATFRARLAGASNAELTTAYLSAAQVPLSSRTPTAVAANVASALPLQTEESRQCTITRAVASALGLPAKQAAQAAAISSGFDAASYSSSLTQLSSFADPSLFAAAVQQHLGAKAAEMSDFQTLSFGFAVAMESFQGYAMPLQVALFMLDPTRRSVSQLATLALCTGAGLSDLAIALVAGMPNTGDLRTTALLLGQAMTGMKEVPSSPIARTALRHAVVALAAQREPKGDHEQLLSAGLRYSITPWASLIARRAAESLQAEGGDLAAKVNSEVAASSSGAAQAADIVERSAAAHLAAVHAGLDGSECARTVLAVLDTEAALGAFLVPLWAQKWPPRAADVITSSATASVAVLEHFSQGSLEPCLGHAVNSTACSPQPASGCALQTGLSLGFTCESFCSSWSTVSWPKQCLGFRRSCTTELLGCNYAVTSQDLTQSSSGVCVCSDARQSVNGATENAQRLARLSMELQTLEFLAPVASTGMPPTEVQLLASEALRQAANVSRPNIVATTVAVGGRVTPALTPTQVAYVAFSLALQQGFARSEAAMAALEVSSLDEDNNLAPLADVMILSGLDVPEARALVVATAMRQLRKSPQALRQAFWRLQMLDDGARQLRRSTILGTFEGSSAYMIYLTDKEAFQSTATAARSAMAAGAQASEMLQYLMASGYSFDQAIQMLNVQADQAMQTTGATLAQRFTFPIYTPLAAAWWSEGSSTSTLPVVPLQQAHEQVILQALAQHFVLDPAQILFLTRPGSARRLQTVSLAKCSLDFVVEVLPSNDANSLEQRLGRFGSAWSFDSFRQRLATAMNESGLVLPSCFSGDPTVAVQHVQVINDFALASSEWLASEWGACPGLCGEAVHSRGVECSTGNEYACNVSGNKPPTTQRCEIYVDCPFDWNCPFGGPGADLACPVQLFLFVTGVVIVSILLLCILRLVVRHFCCQRPKGGELALYGKHGQQMKVNFYIVEQKGEQEDLNVMKMLSLQSKEAEDPSKLHVVWDVDVEKAQKMEIEKWKMKKIGGGITSEQQQRALQRLPGNANNGRKYARQSTGEMLRMSEQEAKVEWALSQKSHKTSSSRRSSPSRRVSRDASPSKSPRSKSSSGGDQEKDQPYPLNARVEYFSSNNCRWLPATIGSSYTEDGYDIHLTGVRGYGAQTRAKVELHQLRAPILEGEFVSVFSTKEEIWHHGTVLSKALPSVAVVGFTIKILHEDEEMILHNVPLHHVWRRFPEGMPVQVYQDEIGWMNAQVLRDAEMIEPLPEKDAMPSWYTVEVAYDHGETEEVPGYRVQRQVMSL